MKTFENFFIPPRLRSGEGGVGVDPSLSLQDVLVGSDGKSGILLYYTEILTAVAAIITFSYIVFAGYQMFTAFGDESKYAAGKKTLQYAIIGFIISLLAYFLINFAVSILGYQN